MNTLSAERFMPVSRLKQLALITEALIDEHPVMVHGSLAHAAVRGASLPSELKKHGELRDIDVFTKCETGKLAVEATLSNLGLGTPCPIDAGLCGLLLHDSSGNFAVHKDGITVGLDDPEGLFEQIEEYEVVGSDGITIRSFTPLGLLAVHSLEPYGRVSHRIPDRLFEMWCEKQGIILPDKTADSIAEFHRAYKEKYPHGRALRYAADIYSILLPEQIRRHFRNVTHRIMNKYAGRENPYE